jgi:hypothetical protein
MAIYRFAAIYASCDGLADRARAFVARLQLTLKLVRHITVV